jgi:hypothetical protein
MSHSKALSEFHKSIAMAEELMKLEKNYTSPPRKAEQAVVEGLRGGAAVLMVAAFEAYLRTAIIEHLAELTKQPPKVKFESLPDKLRVNSTFYCLEAALKGPRYVDTNKIDRLPDIKAACAKVAADVLDPEALSSTQGNPDPNTVHKLFSDIGVKDVFGSNHGKFRRKWGKPVAATFVRDKLDEIVQRRHIVAHTGKALDIGRADLNEAIKFLLVLAELLYGVLQKHLADITA